MSKPIWIGVDWGTSNLRAFAIDHSGTVLEEKSSSQGMGALKPSEFESTLLALIETWLEEGKTIPVYACGMVGARQGWSEAGYRPVPCAPVSPQGLKHVASSDPRINVHILSGLSQDYPADVMRGEETQIAGLLALKPNFNGTVCLPGTHSKWAHVEQNTVHSFQTFMTGELFSILSSHSVLRHNLSPEAFDMATFIDSALKAVANPLMVSTDLFSLRAAGVLHNETPEYATARLSGMLIGQELAATREHWQNKPVALIASSSLSSLYVQTLETLGANIMAISSKEATLSGLKIIANQLETA